jgi:hypothetical protein
MADGDPKFSTTVRPRTLGQNVLDTIRAHAGPPPCPECGYDDGGDGRVAFSHLLFDGEEVETISFVVPVENGKPEEISVQPVAIIITDALAARLAPRPAHDDDASPPPG